MQNSTATRFLFLSLLLGCSSIREVTYPPDFRYVDNRDSHSAMHQMARDVIDIDRVLAARADIDPAAQARVVALLSDMRTASATLDGGAPTNHPVVDRHATSFRLLLDRALNEAQRDPPTYYLAGSVTG